MTEKGEIVLDTVCSSITAASYESASGIEYLDIYILENDEGMYAVCGADGAWCTGFEYTQVLPMELGALCIEDAEAKLAVCGRRTARRCSTRRILGSFTTSRPAASRALPTARAGSCASST